MGKRERPSKGPESEVIEKKILPFLDKRGYKLRDEQLPIPMGRETKYADIVCYIVKKERKVPELVVEAKAPGEPLDPGQAESYALMLKSPYFLVTDGKDWHWYKTGERIRESERLEKEPTPPVEVFEQPLVQFETLNDLKRVMQQGHDLIRDMEGQTPEYSFDEISKLLFAKMWDEKEVLDDKKSRYEFRILKNEDYPNGGWSDTVKRVKNIFEKAKKRYPEIFEETKGDIKNIRLDPYTVYRIVQLLQGYTLTQTSIDLKGATYEIFIKGTFTGKGLGQFFTPREIVEFMIKMIEPKKHQFIIDPACGSGGFLIFTMKHVWDQIEEGYRQRFIQNKEKEKEEFADGHLFGTDLNERLIWVCKMNMVMHGDGHGNIIQHDGLMESERVKPLTKVLKERGGFDVVITNPPFGSKVTDKNVLTRYELGKDKNAQLTEVLFLERCIRLLRPEGMLGIVVPDGILTNSSLQEVRDFILKHCIVKAVVSLPNETFMPYGTGVKPSLLFLQKKKQDETVKNYPIFMAIAEHIGYDATGRPDPINDLNTIYQEYQKFKENPNKYKSH